MQTVPETKRTAVIDKANGSTAEFEHTVIGGYLLEEQIGIGGYGEVWRAIGPGGLPKAVKLLFGQYDGPQAESEIRSLERMRSLRHPFLLNVERIDVEKGRLYVVTELADGSLEDRFQKARKEGLRGLPREELLGYLRDAADALDFMADQHGLQHLDIKPENLLFQGAHIKVGDFGLTKDITSSNVSMISGFTPLYSPPEVFEGKPCRASDQYSLAIVYQTMLTGVAPFSGTTPAQLTAQHLKSTPDLQDLQPVDRPVVARALSKSPAARFPSCRDFVNALCERRASRVNAVAGSNNTPKVDRQTRHTRVIDAAAAAEGSPVHCKLATPVAPTADTIPEQSHRPTVFIGLGGLGGSVLCSLNDKFKERFGEDHSSAFSFLYIDSDVTSIECAHDQSGGTLNNDQILLTPLKDARDYRKSHQLGWLSRRWLFNIPRSGQVEGIRALGRLAFVDHVQTIRRRIQEVISSTLNSVCDPDSETAKLNLAKNEIDVVIVTSTAGGVGSGSVPDLAYLVREILSESGVDSSRVSACLLHATGASRQMADLQEANTVCCLKELQFFNTAGINYSTSWMNNVSVGAMHPFDDTCVVHLGDQLGAFAFSDAAQKVTNYLFTQTATSVRGHFESSRVKSSDELSMNEPQLRTFGVSSIDEALLSFARKLCHGVVQNWKSGNHVDQSENGQASAFEENAAAIIDQLEIGQQQLAAFSTGSVHKHPGVAIQNYFQKVWNTAGQQSSSEPLNPSSMFQSVADCIETHIKERDSDIEAVRDSLKQQVDDLGNRVEARLQQLVTAALCKSFTVHGAADRCSVFLDVCDSATKSCQQLLKEHQHEFQSFCEANRSPEQKRVKRVCIQYLAHRLLLEICHMMCVRFEKLSTATEKLIEDQLSTRGSHLDTLEAAFAVDEAGNEERPAENQTNEDLGVVSASETYAPVSVDN